jgi:hypothetical protein
MVRRFLCVGAVLLLLLSVPACGSSTKTTTKGATDPTGDFVPKPKGAKAG